MKEFVNELPCLPRCLCVFPERRRCDAATHCGGTRQLSRQSEAVTSLIVPFKKPGNNCFFHTDLKCRSFFLKGAAHGPRSKLLRIPAAFFGGWWRFIAACQVFDSKKHNDCRSPPCCRSGGSEKFAAVGSRFPAERGLIELSVDCAVSPGRRAQAGKSLVFSAACQGHTNAVWTLPFTARKTTTHRDHWV